ncbi:MAG TPA: RNA polymerase sigma factor [Armatimonadota bacterium]|nr:RNA polymerase sigma factor [Armatimonadota bacterium]
MDPAKRWRRLYLRLVDLHHDRVYGHLRLLCGDDALAADLTSETFMQVWLHPPRSRRAGALRAYVFNIAVNQFRQHRRRRGVETVPVDDVDEPVEASDDDPLNALAEAELSDALASAVEQLPEIHRLVALLHSIEGLTLRETAEILEIPVGTAKSRLNAALKMLRRSLREWKGE